MACPVALRVAPDTVTDPQQAMDWRAGHQPVSSRLSTQNKSEGPHATATSASAADAMGWMTRTKAMVALGKEHAAGDLPSVAVSLIISALATNQA